VETRHWLELLIGSKDKPTLPGGLTPILRTEVEPPYLPSLSAAVHEALKLAKEKEYSIHIRVREHGNGRNKLDVYCDGNGIIKQAPHV